ncbi:hypothetical protein LZ32DRAFT_455977 [Colletotrichum eremochloae]|nr:hypothetical protein LZ32DRAFT_455977 [Colletotrichum eremochloae]
MRNTNSSEDSGFESQVGRREHEKCSMSLFFLFLFSFSLCFPPPFSVSFPRFLCGTHLVSCELYVVSLQNGNTVPSVFLSCKRASAQPALVTTSLFSALDDRTALEHLNRMHFLQPPKW